MWLGSETDLGAVLVPFVVAGGSLAVLALLGAGRRFLAIPVAAGIVGALVGGALAPGAAIPAAVFAVVGAGALALATTRAPSRVRGLLPSSRPSASAARGSRCRPATRTRPRGRGRSWLCCDRRRRALLAATVWPASSWRRRRGPPRRRVVRGVSRSSIPSWLLESAAASRAVHSRWMWLGTVASVLLGGRAPRAAPRARDRSEMVVPRCGAWRVRWRPRSTTAPLGWLPAALSAVVVVGIRSRVAARRDALAAVGPLLVALALGRRLGGDPGCPPLRRRRRRRRPPRRGRRPRRAAPAPARRGWRGASRSAWPGTAHSHGAAAAISLAPPPPAHAGAGAHRVAPRRPDRRRLRQPARLVAEPPDRGRPPRGRGSPARASTTSRRTRCRWPARSSSPEA